MLFDNDMMMFLTKDNQNTKTNDLINEKEGLIRGNMFESEYKPYKNYTPNIINANNNKDSLFLKLYETNFAIIDLNLYLDLHPNDNQMYEIYKKYVNNFEKLKKMYEENFGPLEITCVDSDTYNWIKNPWPWDNDGGNQNV